MLIKEISPISQSRYCVMTDIEQNLVLYKSEIKKYNLEEGTEVSDSVYEEIVTLVLMPRARKRAMNLLERAERTENELAERLEKDCYPQCCIDDAITYVEKYGYLNDDRYIENFIRSKGSKKSRKELEFLLGQKGFSKKRVSEFFDTMRMEVSDRTAIESLMKKKNFDPACADEQKKQKMIQYLLRKGFNYYDIRQVIQISDEDA